MFGSDLRLPILAPLDGASIREKSVPVHPSAFVHPAALIDPTAEIGPHVVIDGPVTVGRDCRIGPSAVILGHTEIGAGCRIHSYAVIGDVPQDRKFQGGISYCRVGSGCVIREGVTIHRAVEAGAATVVGDNCHLMTNSHVAHDCVLGAGITLVSGALLGGHVQVGKGAVVSGNVGVHQFVRIGELAMIGAVSMITQDIPPFLMTDRDGSVIGLNSIGLMRAGVTSGARNEIKTLFKLMYHSGMRVDEALEHAQQIVSTDFGRIFIEFFQTGSCRGLRRGVGRKRKAA